ncbi:aspartate carbamoyltransferase [Porphyromonas gulae]|uniref:Aspartate carbamoyltransferase regulatory chain n=1 Tax=Porphyromonas gulae TaxID=111105 RepID=A0A099WVQ7_9PORP|nr:MULTISPECIES: aspartate carbamoyltransferase regulatory subunit [Porphyromonas]KGL48751.1 aspartate carbamoyltransferase [Porphyromonas gulae]KGL55329.1 aspartate carbamoyltransferase [Porphyromonas sp. COT-052 OH4946]KGN69097.1 aspartate carbamoyltransferase [Porphyromonas gulae]KGN74633.1 aspartate carbamoyltransferase [Porphyromonas gulae]KGN88260.1 aspartate carbamoyltransferase [Porphyromonas gulae]
MKKEEMLVAAIRNGIVIDHIPPTKLFKVATLLQLDDLDKRITIGNNLRSRSHGSKGVIKIEDKTFDEEELNRIALIAPNVRLNIIRDYEVVEKRQVEVPQEVVGLVRCPNPKCITNNELMQTRFRVIDAEQCTLRCDYCERKLSNERIELL